jgi:hypothetical protein
MNLELEIRHLGLELRELGLAHDPKLDPRVLPDTCPQLANIELSQRWQPLAKLKHRLGSTLQRATLHRKRVRQLQ